MSRTEEEQIKLLDQFSACDVSDALLKLEKPRPGHAAKAGFLGDIVPFAPSSPFLPNLESQPKVIARVSTLKLIDKADEVELPAQDQPHAIPKGTHWADGTQANTVLIIEQPCTQTCAAVGGIMASRMKMRGLRGCIVDGRVRDLAELKSSGLPIWASGRSTVGAGAESKVYAQNVAISVNQVSISAGDIVLCDPLEGVVVIPRALVDEVIDLMPQLVDADDKVKKDVENGSSVQTAFKARRS